MAKIYHSLYLASNKKIVEGLHISKESCNLLLINLGKGQI